MNEKMPAGSKFLPAFFVPVVELGEEFDSGKLPLHMTYFPPIQRALDQEMIDSIRAAVNPLSSFDATIGHGAVYGPVTDPLYVRTLETSPELIAVHEALSSVLDNEPHDRTYRRSFMPHITGSPAPQGERIHMGGLSIVEKYPQEGVWRVMAKIGLKGGME